MNKRKRHIILYVMMIILVLVAIEAISFGTLSLLYRHISTYSRVHSSIETQQKTTDIETALTRSVNTLHPYLGYVRNAQSAIFDANASHVPLSVYGFWDYAGELVKKRRHNEIVIGIFGGSVAHRFAKNPGGGIDTLIKQLRSIPEYSDKEFTISAPAIGGYKQPQQLLAYSYLLSQGAVFDIVLSIDGFNEVTMPELENVPKDVNPFYPRGWFFTSQTEFNPVFQEIVSEISSTKRKRMALASRYNNTPLRYSYTALLLWKLLDQYKEQQLFFLRASLADMENNTPIQYGVSGPRPIFSDKDDLTLALVEQWQQGALQMHRLSEANNIRYFHFLQPNQYVEGSKPLSSEEREMHGIYKTYVRKGYPLLQDAGIALLDAGMSFADMTMVFSTREETAYADDCCHYNVKGNDILGNAIGEFIVSELAK